MVQDPLPAGDVPRQTVEPVSKCFRLNLKHLLASSKLFPQVMCPDKLLNLKHLLTSAKVLASHDKRGIFSLDGQAPRWWANSWFFPSDNLLSDTDSSSSLHTYAANASQAHTSCSNGSWNAAYSGRHLHSTAAYTGANTDSSNGSRLDQALQAPHAQQTVRVSDEEKLVSEDADTLQRSVDFVLALIKLEVELHGINASRIFLAGFGQGGALAAAVALQCPEALGGVGMISAWFPRTSLACLRRAPAPVLSRQHLLVVHGENDTDIPAEAANASAYLAMDAGMEDVEVVMFPALNHSCHSAMVDELCRMIVERAPKPPHLPDQYIPTNQWLDYSQSERTTGRSLPTRRAMPVLPMRFDALQVHKQGARREVTGSRTAQPQDEAFMSSESRSADVEVMVPEARDRRQTSDSQPMSSSSPN